MTNDQIIQEFREKFKFHPYGVFKDGAHYSPDFTSLTHENVESFLLSILQSKDQEKEEALKEQMDNFLNQDANQHDQMVREKALEDYKKDLREKVENHEEWKADEILTLIK
mgnify:CR=1 FL=1